MPGLLKLSKQEILKRIEEITLMLQEVLDNREYNENAYKYGFVNGLLYCFNTLYDIETPVLPLPEEFEEVLDVDFKKIVKSLQEARMIKLAFESLDDLIADGKIKPS